MNYDGGLFDPRLYELIVLHGVLGVAPHPTKDPVAAFIGSRYPEWWFRPGDTTITLGDARNLWSFGKRPGLMLTYSQRRTAHQLKVIPPDRDDVVDALRRAGFSASQMAD